MGRPVVRSSYKPHMSYFDVNPEAAMINNMIYTFKQSVNDSAENLRVYPQTTVYKQIAVQALSNCLE